MVIPSMEKSNAAVCRLRRYAFPLVCFLWTSFSLALWVLNDGIHIKQFQPPRPKPVPQTYNSSIISAVDMGISDEEWERLQKSLDWPMPDQEITHLNQSTSPVHSTFSIVGLKESYKVGENISVIIRARDHNDKLKRYGGDFFKAKLFNSDLKASVYGEVVDHHNGTYSVAFRLAWEGQAHIHIRLEHSSEVVQILKKYRESSFPRSHYSGYFEGSGPNKTRISEVVECNLKWGADGSWRKGDCCCEHKDIRTGTVWQCVRPKKLSCDKLVHHSLGRFENPLNPFEQQLFTKKLTNVAIRGDQNIIHVLPNTTAIGTVEKCRTGTMTPVPSGFYLRDVWKSFVCNTRQFSSAQMGNCLKNKIVYLMGDSTTRQWFEYFERNMPGIKRLDLHTPRTGGPLMAVELKNNTIIHWKPHGVPLRFTKMLITDLHYISNDIDEIAGGHHVVIVFTFFAHLVFHPITFYVYEVAKIRQSVVALLSRAPETIIIIKSGNTAGLKNIFQSDWYVLQLDTVMREMFRDIEGIIFLDVWQMTSCHYLREDIHPGPIIVANEVNMLLSYICPT
ncbi:NXPE family member 3-like [Carassius auratus]|uniref:NXPE family member 3-like n=1 Tax=Carassius auratus TaxID=7957 RepID=A0A6P6R3X9_CARAU|nr:NXPE family member 3-like [Carassius auratus]XP_026140459.1 NXPE family member 3-like [Carassius auratus]XP_026140532.1 NXPE family member 3-like [Carassius auratus]XP_026140603.1 NXPE family member 3-like [Carassius auratus]XP_026140671.1 NXPE family member 3-like [Carassius auratus]